MSAHESLNTTMVPPSSNGRDSTREHVQSGQTIRTAESRTYLWLNGFHHDTSTEQIIKLVATTMNVQECDVICRSLKSNRRTYTDFDQVSFRVGVKSSDAKDALTTDRWPKGIMCKLFKSKNSKNRQPVRLG